MRKCNRERVRELSITIEALEQRNERECFAKTYNARAEKIKKLNKELKDLEREIDGAN